MTARRYGLRPEPRIACITFVLAAALAGASVLPGTSHGHALNRLTTRRTHHGSLGCSSVARQPQHHSRAADSVAGKKQPQSAMPHAVTRTNLVDGRRPLSLRSSGHPLSTRRSA